MRKVTALVALLLGLAAGFAEPRLASAWACPPASLSCTVVDDYVEICTGGLGARICTVYRCSNGTSYTCCTECEGPN